MYCPKCATENMDNARYCRACGLDISLVSTALAGRRPEAPAIIDEEEDDPRESRRRRRRQRSKKPATYEKAFENLGVGFAFLIISIVIAIFVPSGRFWWFWLLIPAFACLGEGTGQLLRLRRELPSNDSTQSTAELSNAPTAQELPPPRHTSEIMSPPPSVTEGTTRHLGAERKR